MHKSLTFLASVSPINYLKFFPPTNPSLGFIMVYILYQNRLFMLVTFIFFNFSIIELYDLSNFIIKLYSCLFLYIILSFFMVLI